KRPDATSSSRKNRFTSMLAADPTLSAGDVGFIHDTLKKKWKTLMFAHPVVEFFTLLGLQRARPQPTDKVRVYDYSTWSRGWRCQAVLLPLAVCGLLGDKQARRYRFVNAFRTGQKKHKAYMPASPLPTGDLP